MVYEYDYRGDDKGMADPGNVALSSKQGALYERFNEFHEEKHHNLRMSKKPGTGGFTRAIWGIFSKEPPAEGCRRLLLVAEAL